MYEPRHHPLLPRAQFVQRLLRHAGYTALVLAGSLGVGMAGYHALEGLDWIDAFLNSAMLLGGMGPVNAPRTNPGKLFAGTYALYAGLVFIVAGGLLLAPALHRLVHRFHLQSDARSGR